MHDRIHACQVAGLPSGAEAAELLAEIAALGQAAGAPLVLDCAANYGDAERRLGLGRQEAITHGLTPPLVVTKVDEFERTYAAAVGASTTARLLRSPAALHVHEQPYQAHDCAAAAAAAAAVAVDASLARSKGRLGQDTLDTVCIHNFNMYKHDHGGAAWDRLKQHRANGSVGRIGVSVCAQTNCCVRESRPPPHAHTAGLQGAVELLC